MGVGGVGVHALLCCGVRRLNPYWRLLYHTPELQQLLCICCMSGVLRPRAMRNCIVNALRPPKQAAAAACGAPHALVQAPPCPFANLCAR